MAAPSFLNVDTKRKEQVVKAYNLDSVPCKENCKRLTKPNPYCLCTLGNAKWESVKEKAAQQVETENVPRNLSDDPVGLTNEGNTCYMNSYLQVWYNDPFFRKAVYDFVTLEDWKKEEGVDIQDIMSELRRLFCEMQITPFIETSPREFMNILRLTTEQQDAQEFGQLFLQKLEDSLKIHPNGGRLADVLDNRYKGRQVISMSCKACGHLVEHEEPFRELRLSVDGKRSLVDALQSAFAKEDIDWTCSGCGHTKATRSVSIRKVGPVLVLMLNRFIYERQTLRKKKICHGLNYARKLNLRPLMEELGGPDCEYRLSAMLVHQGQSAHAGHYYAIIEEPFTEKWHKFNDREVQQLQGRKIPGTDNEDDRASSSTESRGAYMLVYHSVDAEKPTVQPTPPQDLVETLGVSLEEEFASQNRDRNVSLFKSVRRVQSKADNIQALWEKLRVSNKPNVDNLVKISLVPTKLLQNVQSLEQEKGLQQPEESDADTSQTIDIPVSFDAVAPNYDMCVHHKVPPGKVTRGDWRAVHSIGLVEGLLKRYKVDQVNFNITALLCVDCVDEELKHPGFKDKLEKDVKQILDMNKKLPFSKIRPDTLAPSLRPQFFYVEKDSLKRWKSLANQARTDKQATLECAFVSSQNEYRPVAKRARIEQPKLFNPTLTCEHGHLNPKCDYVMVNSQVWNILYSHFPYATVYTGEDEFCAVCLQELMGKNQVRDENKRMSEELRSRVGDLLKTLRKRRWYEFLPRTKAQQLVVVCRNFLNALEQFAFANDGSMTMPTEVCQPCLLCAHDQLLYPITMPDLDSQDSTNWPVAILTQEEWRSIVQNPIVPLAGQPIMLNNNGANVWQSEPGFCMDCFTDIKQKQNFGYDAASVYVFKVNGDPAQALVAGLRRSNRRTVPRGARDLTVSHRMTLSEFKTELYGMFGVSPNDMHLYVDGRELESDESTLGELRVPAGAVINLKVDAVKPLKQVLAESAEAQGNEPESGFMHTGLGGAKMLAVDS